MSALAAVPDLALRAAIYCRISADQSGDGEGVDRQEQACRELVEESGWDIAEIITDNDISAYSGKRRPGYERLLRLIESDQIDAVVAIHTDRLYRRPRDLERLVDALENHKITVRTVKSGEMDLSTATGRMVAKMLATVSEHESARIGERVADKHKSNAEKGRAHGGLAPFGYRREGPGELVIDPEQAALIVEAADKILRLNASLTSIVIEWNDRGVATQRGAHWRPNALSKVLRAGRIAGLRESHGEVIGEGTWEPILDRVTWERLRSKITHAPIGRRPRVNLLAGFVFCAECGTAMTSRSPGKPTDAEGRKNYRKRSYACDKAKMGGCGSCAAVSERVEAIVVDHILGALERVNLQAVRARQVVASSSDLVGGIAVDEEMLVDLAADLGERRISRAEWMAAREPIDSRITEARLELEKMTQIGSMDDAAFDGVDEDRWGELNLEQRQAIVRLMISRVEIRKGRGGRSFDPSRVTIIPR